MRLRLGKYFYFDNLKYILVVKLDGMNKDEMSAVMKKFDIKSRRVLSSSM